MLTPKSKQEIYDLSSLENYIKIEGITKKGLNEINKYVQKNPGIEINLKRGKCKIKMLDFIKIFGNVFLNSKAFYKLYFNKISLTDNKEIINENIKIIISEIINNGSTDMKYMNPVKKEKNEEITMLKRIILHPTVLGKKIIKTYIKDKSGKEENKQNVGKIVEIGNNNYEMTFLEFTKIFGNGFKVSNSNYKIFFEDFGFIKENFEIEESGQETARTEESKAAEKQKTTQTALREAFYLRLTNINQKRVNILLSLNNSDAIPSSEDEKFLSDYMRKNIYFRLCLQEKFGISNYDNENIRLLFDTEKLKQFKSYLDLVKHIEEHVLLDINGLTKRLLSINDLMLHEKAIKLDSDIRIEIFKMFHLKEVDILALLEKLKTQIK